MLISQYIHIFIWGIGFVENFADSQVLLLKMKVNSLKLIWIYFSKAGNIKTNCTGEQLDAFEHFAVLVKSKVLRQRAMALLCAALPTHGTLVCWRGAAGWGQPAPPFLQNCAPLREFISDVITKCSAKPSISHSLKAGAISKAKSFSQGRHKDQGWKHTTIEALRGTRIYVEKWSVPSASASPNFIHTSCCHRVIFRLY